ncbi:hypothetical protein NEMBOFW57_010668 [Staphylotrichum longicolle]|uniref:BTB domain-containing protein n=1 Tax=Staphylotrichum longicolle TaxID=669026 RepID=A0AAD4HT49_9PEZI|nr:hypothetical protein NEMBOFW57_010668 [Staphylotrichum longicolle]
MPSDEAEGSRASSVGADYRDDEYHAIDDPRTPSIYSALSSLLGSERFSDMTIRCGGREFKAHRAIVCPQSPFFDRALTGGFAVSDSPGRLDRHEHRNQMLITHQESATNTVDLPEDDPDVLECFLQFLYTGTYKHEGTSAWAGPADVCRLTPEEIEEELNTIPGVNVAGPSDEEDHASTLKPTVTMTEGTDGESHTEEGDWETEQSDEQPEDPDEPLEEYNDFGGEYDEGPSCGRRLAQLTDELGLEEGTKQFYREVHSELELFLPLRLYVMADKFDVPALKLLARDRFYRAAELSWKHAECFPDVVDELYTNLPPTDIAMREIVCRLVGCAIKDKEQRDRMGDVMRKHGDFAVGVMNYMLASEDHLWT